MEYLKKHKLIFFAYTVIILICLFWSTQKSGLMIDEIYQHCLANGVFPPFVGEENSLRGDNMIDTVIIREELKSFIEVSPETRFDFENVYINHSQDNHLPLYGMILHGIYSFFWGVGTLNG